jgi:lipopolysaccharide transport system permease protein
LSETTAQRAGPTPARRLGGSEGLAPALRPGTPSRAFDLLVALARSDLYARYGRGPWRLIKWLLDPFALVGVYLIFIAAVLDRPGLHPGLTLACAVVPFQLVMMSVVNAFDSVRVRRSIILNMSFPRLFIPAASVLTEAVAFGASMLLLALMMAAYGVAPTVAVAWLPLVLLTNLAFAAAIAYPTSLIGIWVPDIRPFTISFVRALFFLAPGVVALDQIAGSANDLVRLNPLTGLFEAYRAVLVHGSSPEAWQLAYPLLAAAVLAAVFLPIYRAEQRQFAKVIE